MKNWDKGLKNARFWVINVIFFFAGEPASQNLFVGGKMNLRRRRGWDDQNAQHIPQHKNKLYNIYCLIVGKNPSTMCLAFMNIISRNCKATIGAKNV